MGITRLYIQPLTNLNTNIIDFEFLGISTRENSEILLKGYEAKNQF